MPVTAIVGANWGDEGKGKITDFLAAKADYVVRFQGGNNAGHTIINRYGKFALHLLPSGVFHPNTVNVLGPGVALNIEALLREIEHLRQRGVNDFQLKISDRTQIVMPYHLAFDRLEEERRGGASFGSTRSGIAPFYSDVYAKVGIQANELYNQARLRERLAQLLPQKNLIHRQLYHQAQDWEIEQLLFDLQPLAQALQPYLCDTTTMLRQALAQKAQILLEGQLGALRDPIHGIYPYSTSSSTLAGFAAIGAGIPAAAISEVLAITKCYSSCVGSGPMVGDLTGAEGDELRRRGGDAGEYGATTGRPRRVAWFDCVASRYGVQIQGATAVGLTNLDVLGYLPEIPVCVAYRIGDQTVTQFPPTSELDFAQPVYQYLPGWLSSLGEVKSFSQLPARAQDYVRFIEAQLGVPIRWLSYGPRREQTLALDC